MSQRDIRVAVCRVTLAILVAGSTHVTSLCGRDFLLVLVGFSSVCIHTCLVPSLAAFSMAIWTGRLGGSKAPHPGFSGGTSAVTSFRSQRAAAGA